MGKIHEIADFKLENFAKRYRISTIGFLVQQFYRGVHDEFKDKTTRLEKFRLYMGNYEIPMKQYRRFIENEIDVYDPDKHTMPRTKALIFEFIYTNWNKIGGENWNSDELRGQFEESVHDIDVAMDDDGFPKERGEYFEEDQYIPDQPIYMPHPLDGLFVIDHRVKRCGHSATFGGRLAVFSG